LNTLDQIESESCDLDHTAFRGFVIRKLGLYIDYMCVKFDDSSLSRFRDITGGAKYKMGHVTMTTPILRAICRQYAVALTLGCKLVSFSHF